MVTESAVYQNNQWTYLENKDVEPHEPIQMNIYQVNTYRKDLSWLHFIDESRVRGSNWRTDSPAYPFFKFI